MPGLPEAIQEALESLEEHFLNLEANIRGGNGYLFFAQNKISNANVAIKFYAGESGDQQHDEPRKLAAIQSPNVLPIHEARNISDGWAYFITPRCDGGDLDDTIQSRPSMHEAIDIAIGICEGVGALHSQRMVHRDLKPANIVMHEGKPRIADFGSVRAIAIGEEDTHSSRHSVLYRPPESFVNDRYGFRGDIYQIGLVTYQLLGGWFSYDGIEYLKEKELRDLALIADPVDRSLFVDSVIEKRSRSGTLVRLGSLPPWAKRAKRAIRSMTNPNPSARPSTVADVVAALTKLRVESHDWQWAGTTARLTEGGRTLELQPCPGGNYQAYQTKGGARRRLGGSKAAKLEELVEEIER
ncbi:MAG: serine/threonine-protein kinase [Terracidiphilus sp.]|jgi:serine/threonine protein kinase